MSWQESMLRSLRPTLLPSDTGWTFEAVHAHQLREILLDAPGEAIVRVPDHTGRHRSRLNLQFGEELYLSGLTVDEDTQDVMLSGDHLEVQSDVGRTFALLKVWELRRLLRQAGEAPVWVMDARGRVRPQVNLQIGPEVYLTGDTGNH